MPLKMRIVAVLLPAIMPTLGTVTTSEVPAPESAIEEPESGVAASVDDCAPDEEPLPHAAQAMATHIAKKDVASFGARARTAGTKPTTLVRHNLNSMMGSLSRSSGISHP